MASVRGQIVIGAQPELVWDVLRDVVRSGLADLVRARMERGAAEMKAAIEAEAAAEAPGRSTA